MTYEEAISSIRTYMSYPNGKVTESGRLAIEAMEKQIPKNPIWEGGHCYCPNKHKSVIKGVPYWTIGTGQKYCDYCGQKLDWSEVEE